MLNKSLIGMRLENDLGEQGHIIRGSVLWAVAKDRHVIDPKEAAIGPQERDGAMGANINAKNGRHAHNTTSLLADPWD
jgi:hypothetical protein